MQTKAKKEAKTMTPKQAAILKAATHEFCAAGFSGTSMDRIAEVANVSKTTVYNHFPSKDDLFQAILNQLIFHIGEMESFEYSSEEPLERQLEVIGRIFADTVTGEDFMNLSRVVISRLIRSKEWAESAFEQQGELRANITRWIDAGNEDGRLNVPNPDKAAAQFVGLIKEVVFWPELMWGQRAATPLERDEAVRSAVNIFLDHFRAESSA